MNNCFDINEDEAFWIPENIKNSNNSDSVKVKLLCGGDLLESFGTPGLWTDEDVIISFYLNFYLELAIIVLLTESISAICIKIANINTNSVILKIIQKLVQCTKTKEDSGKF